MALVEELYLHPIRCITCGKVIAHLTESLEHIVKSGSDADAFLTSKGFPPSRYCCRRALLAPIRGYFLDSEANIEEEIYTPETFEETHDVIDSDEEDKTDIARKSFNALERAQRNVQRNESNLYLGGRKRRNKGKTRLNLREFAEGKSAGIPGRKRK